jgi:hypothetical protein
MIELSGVLAGVFIATFSYGVLVAVLGRVR